MKANIDDVARRAGVSTATVSRTFSKPDLVSDKTRAKVMEAADQLGFSVSRTAGVLRSGRSYRVALLVGSGKIEWFTAGLIEGLNAVLRDAGYDLVIYPIDTEDARHKFFEELPLSGNADAVIISSFAASPEEIDRLHHAIRIPIVGINITGDNFTASTSIDDRLGIKLIVKHLTQLGHRNLLYMYEDFTTRLGFSSQNRIAGFRDACAQQGLHGQVVSIQPGGNMLDAMASALYSSDVPITAVCFHQDSQAIPLLYNLHKYGLTVPHDLSITGFDDSTFSADIGLTTVRQDPYAMAAAAARKTLDLIEGRPLDHPHEIFPVQLVVRDTTASPSR
ncbi:LacI-type transcriptional regulator [Bifidobacterium ramosum]|uniref:LacI family DNA-binding transcriptional regulator n=1 Tax=Bifidobacterium ramosum TaxID=1798158 RepID=A0A6L4X0V9_9BIFI|nr:LacI family DNA-binding transcriptional regulator [Bifidobacterium ramosum]KAB8288431.1 LacI-type transcriptional regulator [Bifidobacterium ramosum]NEG71535.1 LacI family DNA-binding transcriptional regulator [Bifidobacterium ramosum]